MEYKSSVGQSDFRRIRQQGQTLVDKTSFISKVLADSSILVFPRPRRFGKTTNLSSLRYFVEKSEEDRSDLFKGLKVWEDSKARAHFQRYPVIFLTFKDIKVASKPLMMDAIHHQMRRLYNDHLYLLESGQLTPMDQELFRAVQDGTGSEVYYEQSLFDLSRHLAAYHKERVVILVDEYDTPIHSAYVGKFYDPIVDFFRNFFSAAFKDNPHLFKGVFTGILRVAKESLFSGLNNTDVYSLIHDSYQDAFGFTEEEVLWLLDQAGCPEIMDGIRRTYNGYLFGLTHPVAIYNPWSVLMCVKEPSHPFSPHWLNTGSDSLLRDLMVTKGLGLYRDMERLLSGATVEKPIQENLALRDVEQNHDALWSFLLFSGYLTPKHLAYDEIYTILMGELKIPNPEVASVFRTIFRGWMQDRSGTREDLDLFWQALLTGDSETVQLSLRKILLHKVSIYDYSGHEPEKLYRGLIIGLLVCFDRDYRVMSNRESGYGRADVLISPRQPGKPGAVLELKVKRDHETPAMALQKALTQIEERKYVTELEAAGASAVQVYAVAFDGKQVWCVMPGMALPEAIAKPVHDRIHRLRSFRRQRIP